MTWRNENPAFLLYEKGGILNFKGTRHALRLKNERVSYSSMGSVSSR